MAGVDVEVIKAQISVLREAQRLHRLDLQEAEQLELAALEAEQRARDEQDRARKAAEDARTVIREYGDEIDEMVAVLAAIPKPRPPEG